MLKALLSSQLGLDRTLARVVVVSWIVVVSKAGLAFLLVVALLLACALTLVAKTEKKQEPKKARSRLNIRESILFHSVRA